MHTIETLTDLASKLGIQVRKSTKLGGHAGVYLPTQNLILLNREYPAEYQLYALAHELGHAIHGHDCSTLTSEHEADKHAVSLLIDDDDYRAAEVEAEGNLQGIAAIMELPAEAIQFYQSMLLRTETCTYKQPRHGAKTYTAKYHLETV